MVMFELNTFICLFCIFFSKSHHGIQRWGRHKENTFYVYMQAVLISNVYEFPINSYSILFCDTMQFYYYRRNNMRCFIISNYTELNHVIFSFGVYFLLPFFRSSYYEYTFARLLYVVYFYFIHIQRKTRQSNKFLFKSIYMFIVHNVITHRTQT